MVGGFPIIQSFHSRSSHKRDLIGVSVPALVMTLMLMHSALAHEAPCIAASPAHVSRAMLRTRTRNVNDVHKPRCMQSSVMRREPGTRPQVPNTHSPSQNHRHLLVIGAYAVASTSGVDHTVRALVGSAPPTCIKKCGKCIPCKSVLVPIHATTFPSTSAEYYPEAWRCQCKGKLYNP